VRKDRPLIQVLTTGGTIAGVYDASRGGVVPALSGDELLRAVPGIGEVARLRVEEVANVDSADMTPAIWRVLATRVNALQADGEIDGVVITHGTDTMEESAWFLDLTVSGSKPVVLVGAQRAANYFDADGPRNLLDAVRVAACEEAIGKGVVVVMNSLILAARDVTKTSTLQRETFQSLEFGPLGTADIDVVRFGRSPMPRQHIALRDGVALGRVEIVSHYAGADGRLIDALLRDGEPLDGLVLAATGLGNANAEMQAAVERAIARGVVVVVSTRVHTGRTMALYAGPGKSVDLVRAGCILAGDLSPQKARVSLMLALTQGRGKVPEYFSL
jgi:L-asparaginase